MTEIHRDIINRYDNMLAQLTPYVQCIPDPGIYLPHLRWMLEEIRSGRVAGEKSHRWIGFVQGVMVMNDMLKVKDERDFTRPYFIEKVD